MASNTTLNPGAAGDIIATKERTHDGDASKVQVVTLAGVAGTEGAYTFADINGDATNGLDVDVTRLPALPAGTNNIGDVDIASALPAGSNNIGDVDVLTVPADPFGANADAASATGSISAKLRFIAATGVPVTSIAAGDNNIGNVDLASAIPAGTNNIGDVDVLTLPALPAGTNNIGDVDIATIAAGDNNIGNVDVLTVPADPFGANADAASATGSISAKLRSIAATGIPITSIAAGDNNIGNVDVLSLPALAAGANNIGDVDVLTLPALPAGTNNIGDVDVLTLPALPAGTNNIGDIDVLSIIPGTGATNLGKAEDAAHANGDVGVMALAVRRDADTTLAAADNDYGPLQLNAAGSLKVAITSGAGSGGTSIADGASFTRNTTSLTPAGAVVETSAPMLTNGDVAGLSQTTGGALRVAVSEGGISGIVDDSAFTPGTTEGVMFMAHADETSADAVDEGDGGAVRMTLNRALHTTLRCADGATAMDETNDAVRVNIVAGAGSGGTSVVDDAAFTAASGSVTPIGGFVTADAVDSGDVGAVAMTTARALHVAVQSIAAGNNNIGDVDVATLPALAAGTNNIGDVDVLTLPALPAGTNNIGDVDVLSLIPGTGATALGKAIDTAGGATDTGVAALLIRDDALTTLTPVDGDYVAGRVDSLGAAWVRSTAEIADDAAFTPATSRVLPVGLMADETATDSVDEGDIGAARMTLDRKAILTPYAHAAAGGATPYQNLDVDETEDEVKGTAGKIFSLHVMNMAATVRYLKVYNATAATVVVGTTTPVFTFPIPTLANTNGAGFTAFFGDIGAQFTTAITIAATTGLAVADTGAPGANEVVVNLTFI